MDRRPARGETIFPPPPPPFGLNDLPLLLPPGEELLLLLSPASEDSFPGPFGAATVSLLAMSARDQILGLLITLVVLVEAPAEAACCCCCCCWSTWWWWCRRASAGCPIGGLKWWRAAGWSNGWGCPIGGRSNISGEPGPLPGRDSDHSLSLPSPPRSVRSSISRRFEGRSPSSLEPVPESLESVEGRGGERDRNRKINFWRHNRFKSRPRD